jgi:hypothetical protein
MSVYGVIVSTPGALAPCSSGCESNSREGARSLCAVSGTVPPTPRLGPSGSQLRPVPASSRGRRICLPCSANAARTQARRLYRGRWSHTAVVHQCKPCMGHCRKLITADAPVGDLLHSGLYIKRPTRWSLLQRHRHRPAATSHNNDHPALTMGMRVIDCRAMRRRVRTFCHASAGSRRSSRPRASLGVHTRAGAIKRRTAGRDALRKGRHRFL